MCPTQTWGIVDEVRTSLPPPTTAFGIESWQSPISQDGAPARAPDGSWTPVLNPGAHGCPVGRGYTRDRPFTRHRWIRTHRGQINSDFTCSQGKKWYLESRTHITPSTGTRSVSFGKPASLLFQKTSGLFLPHSQQIQNLYVGTSACVCLQQSFQTWQW